MTASIVVCTFNRASMLEACLQSILDDGASATREVIVVDNNSVDRTAEVIRDFSERAPGVVVAEREARPGKSAALNRGLARCRGEFLLFTDDDARVRPGWTDAMVGAFADPAVSAVGGRIVPVWPHQPPPWLSGPHSGLLALTDFGDQPRLLDDGEWPLGANMAVRAEPVRRRGMRFEERLGNIGDVSIGHEETHFLAAMRQVGALAYQPAAVVDHSIQAERMELAWLRRTYFQRGFGLGRRERIGGQPAPTVARRVVRGARAYAHAQRLRRRNAGSPAADAAWDELYAYQWAGKGLEQVFGRFTRLSQWMASHLA